MCAPKWLWYCYGVQYQFSPSIKCDYHVRKVRSAGGTGNVKVIPLNLFSWSHILWEKRIVVMASLVSGMSVDMWKTSARVILQVWQRQRTKFRGFDALGSWLRKWWRNSWCARQFRQKCAGSCLSEFSAKLFSTQSRSRRHQFWKQSLE